MKEAWSVGLNSCYLGSAAPIAGVSCGAFRVVSAAPKGPARYDVSRLLLPSGVDGVVFTILITQKSDVFHFGAQLFATDPQENRRLALVEPGLFERVEYGLALECRQVERTARSRESVIALVSGDFGG